MTSLNFDDAWETPLLTLAREAWHVLDSNYQAPADDNSLDFAYKHCTEVTRLHSHSFYLASGLLKPRHRRAIRALYAFSRTADDIVDQNLANSASVPLCQLEAWRQRSLSKRPSRHDLIALAWADTRSRFQVPVNYAHQLLDGLAQDLEVSRYQSFNDLAKYCYGVASTVGLMSMHIIGYESETAVRDAIKLGVALQLTNILRDVAEDWQRGRLYLPQDELVKFGLGEADIAIGSVDDRWRAFMRFQIARTRHIYDEAWPGIQMLDAHGRFSVAAAAGLYRAILDDIEAHDYDVFNRRAYIGKWGKLRRMPRIWWRSKWATADGDRSHGPADEDARASHLSASRS